MEKREKAKAKKYDQLNKKKTTKRLHEYYEKLSKDEKIKKGN